MEKNKPWAVLRISRRRYAETRPWKAAGMDRQDFEKLIQELPDELFSLLRDAADAERLAAAIFGACASCQIPSDFTPHGVPDVVSRKNRP